MSKIKENLEIKSLEFDDEGMHIRDGAEVKSLQVFSTGSLGLDVLLGGGYNPGFMQLWGPDGIGKTTLLFIMAGEYQKAYGYDNVRVYLHATEGRYNPRLLKMAPFLKMEAATEKKPDGNPWPIFRISYPKSGEEMYQFIEKTSKQDKIHFFHIVDSCDGIKSIVNEGKTYSDAEKTANIASLNTRFCKESSVYANQYGHIVAYTHQVRDKIQQGQSHVSGVGKTKSGGHAVDHYSNLRLHFEKLWTDLYIFENPNDIKSKIIGHEMNITLEKVSNSGNVRSKVKVPFLYDHGVDKEREILNLALSFQLLARKGAWITMGDTNLAQGEVKAIKLLKEDKDIVHNLETQIRTMAGLCTTQEN